MKDDIYNFSEQFKVNLRTENKERWPKCSQYILAGMGGSHLQADTLKSLKPNLPLIVHSEYGLPDTTTDTGIICASYSGNTEETISSLDEALIRNLPVIIISKGGKLIEISKEKELPYIKLPEESIQPRLALGQSFKALLKALEVSDLEKQLPLLSKSIYQRRDSLKTKGEELAQKLGDRLPIIYSSTSNEIAAKIFKINFNETTKIPSFYNTVPELNHNEMTSFDVVPLSKHLSGNMLFLLLSDREDSKRNRRRFEVLRGVLEKRGLDVIEVEMEGETKAEKLFTTVILSAWTSYYLSFYYKTDPAGVPMVEEFKGMINE